MSENIITVRKFLKERLQWDKITLKGHKEESENVKQIVQRAVELGESNSLLIIGPRGSGKSVLINSVLADVFSSGNHCNNSILVQLNGNLHTDDKMALRSATVQMKLENVVDGKTFGSFAENLEFLLACLKSGNKRSKSIIFILEEFDLFCAHHNQTLLYNLFDVSQSSQTPICVLGATSRLDVIELLEKRVKSRFSHRQIFIFPHAYTFDEFLSRIIELLSIPNGKERTAYADRVSKLELEISLRLRNFNPGKYKFDEKYVDHWNKDIDKLIRCSNSATKNALKVLYDLDKSESFLKTFLFRIVAQLSPNNQPRITAEQIIELSATYMMDSKVKLLCDLSVLEFCIVIAIKHHSEIYDRDPFNFEMIYSRFEKFAKTSSSMQGIERSVALMAFERLCGTEMILPLLSNTGKIQKEFEMYKLALTYSQINTAVQKYTALPTEVMQWSQNSFV